MGDFLAKESAVQEGKPLIVRGSNGLEIVLIRIEGKIYAYENLCPHEDGPVGEGEVEGRCIICPWHGWSFDITNGECQNVPGEELKKIPLRIEEGSIYAE